MNHIDILVELDTGQITKGAAMMQLAENCRRTLIASLYLTSREERNRYADELRDMQGKTPRPTMDASILLDLIDHALKTDYISAALAERWLLSVGLDAADAKHHIETIVTIKNRDAARAAFLDGPQDTPGYCTRCGIESKARLLSRRALCAECSAAAAEQAIEQLQAKAGPVYRKWRDAMIAYCYTLENEIIAISRDREPSTLGDMIDSVDSYPNMPDLSPC